MDLQTNSIYRLISDISDSSADRFYILGKVGSWGLTFVMILRSIKIVETWRVFVLREMKDKTTLRSVTM